jgi:hypothetical protein
VLTCVLLATLQEIKSKSEGISTSVKASSQTAMHQVGEVYKLSSKVATEQMEKAYTVRTDFRLLAVFVVYLVPYALAILVIAGLWVARVSPRLMQPRFRVRHFQLLISCEHVSAYHRTYRNWH